MRIFLSLRPLSYNVNHKVGEAVRAKNELVDSFSLETILDNIFIVRHEVALGEAVNPFNIGGRFSQILNWFQLVILIPVTSQPAGWRPASAGHK